jgi:hypothetical protein
MVDAVSCFYKMIFSLQCRFIDVSLGEIATPTQGITPALIDDSMVQLMLSIQQRAFLNVYQSILECSEPDIR